MLDVASCTRTKKDHSLERIDKDCYGGKREYKRWLEEVL